MQALDLVSVAMQSAAGAFVLWGGFMTLWHGADIPASGRHMFDEGGTLLSIEPADYPSGFARPSWL